jgi:mannose-1-phosphate guanylyltransferase
MSVCQTTWAVVLAAGDGMRLAALTRDRTGNAVPKQFCSLKGSHSLISETFQRARRVVSPDRACAVVAENHQRYWHSSLANLPSSNVIVQPKNRGTAIGVLLSVLSILELDPFARILFLPADHYVRDECALARSLREAVALLVHNPDKLILVGMEPDSADPELGYIMPGAALGDGSQLVSTYIEKPEPGLARELFAAGALWNSFIFAVSGSALLGLMRRRLGSVVKVVEATFAQQPRGRSRRNTLARLYEALPSTDFSRAIIHGAEASLRVLRAPACGWNDLGTPKRLADISALYHVQLSVPGLHS